MDVEGGVQARDLEQPQDRRVRADQRHVTALAGHAPQPVEQHRKTGRVDELDLAEVEHDGRLAAADGAVEQHAEAWGGGDVDLAGDRDHVGAIVDVLLRQLELWLGKGHGACLPDRVCGSQTERAPRRGPAVAAAVWRSSSTSMPSSVST